MDEQTIDARLARLKKLEYPVSTASGVALAALYFWWRLEYAHVIAIWTSVVAFLIGGAIPKFCISVMETKLERMRRELAEPPRAEVHAIGPGASHRRPALAPAASLQAVPLVEPPKPEPPVDPAAGPRFLS